LSYAAPFARCDKRHGDLSMISPTHHLFQQPWPEGEFRFFQLGFVVDDLLSAAERWVRVHGVGPFHVLPRSETKYSYRGVESSVDMRVAVAQAGPVQIELIQQFCDSPSIFRDLFAKGESGFHQLCTVTSDYPGMKAHYERLGYDIAGEIDTKSLRVAYFDTASDFGFITEVVEHSAGFLEGVARIAETCSTWDGSDPIRLLTRDGYRRP
jgi:hypothetical protein